MALSAGDHVVGLMSDEATERAECSGIGAAREDAYRSPAAKARAEVLSFEVIGAALEVHNQVGPGLLESVYRDCLVEEFRERRIPYRQEVILPTVYKGLRLSSKMRIDLLVGDLVVVELKSVQFLDRTHLLQLLSYLRMSDRWLGLLVNFNTDRLAKGLRRLLNGY